MYRRVNTDHDYSDPCPRKNSEVYENLSMHGMIFVAEIKTPSGNYGAQLRRPLSLRNPLYQRRGD